LLEIGYHVHPELRGQGLASEAARACLSWAFTHTEHELVCCVVDPENAASVRVAERLHRFKRTFQGRTKEMFLFYTTRTAWDDET
jgi:RimJ/RimL family protein N-acetyltransferase